MLTESSRPMSGYGDGGISKPEMTLKAETAAPIPGVSDRMAVRANPGWWRNCRQVWRRSCRRVCISVSGERAPNGQFNTQFPVHPPHYVKCLIPLISLEEQATISEMPVSAPGLHCSQADNSNQPVEASFD